MDPSQVIVRPIVSEKSYVLAEIDQYTFRVHDEAHKTADPPGGRGRSFDVDGARACVRSRQEPSPSAAASTRAAPARGRRPIVQLAPGDTIPHLPGPGGGID